jgi:hypothetical protein
MNNPKKITKQDLETYAHHIIEAYQAGALPESQDKTLKMAWRPLIRSLRSRYPGFSELEYGIALNLGFNDREH